jgi:hypothetical protein
MWIVPAQSEDWTVLFHPRTRLFHTQRPSQDSASLRLRVRPESGAPAEILTFAFTTVARDRTTLEFRWHKSVIPFTIEVPSSRPVLAVEKMSAYTGAWIAHSIGEAGKVDTLEMTITVRDGKLMVRWVKWAWELELLPTRTPHVFLAGFLEKGELVDTEAEYPVVFTMAGDRAVSFVSRSDNGDEWMRGIRAK